MSHGPITNAPSTNGVMMPMTPTLAARPPTFTRSASNLGETGADAYLGNNRATIAASSTLNQIHLSSSKRFPLQSPQQRFFIVDTPISYRCDLLEHHLLRYSDYNISPVQANPPNVTGQLQAHHVNDCTFAYSAGTASHSGLVTLQITLTDSAGESTRLIQQVHVDNAP